MRKPLGFAAMSAAALLGVTLWAWSAGADTGGRWAFVALVLFALWLIVELAHAGKRGREWESIRSWHRFCIAGASLMAAFAAASQLAIAGDLVDARLAPVIRLARGLALGGGMILWGNYLPKLLSPWSLGDEPFAWQRVHRFVGWVFSLGGAAVVLVWIALPVGEAQQASRVILGVCCGLALSRKLLSLAAPPDHHPDPRAGR